MDNRRSRRLVAALGVLSLVAVLGWRWVDAPPADAALVAPDSSADLSSLIAYAAPAPRPPITASASAPVLLPRDPFSDQIARARPAPDSNGARRTARPSTVVASWRVTAVLLGGARRAAVINDSLVYAGDAVPGGGRLTSVDRDRIVVTDGSGAAHVVVVIEGDR